MGRLEGKKAIVTGAAQGLGAAIVERLASEGCDVAAWDVNAQSVLATAEDAAKRFDRDVIGASVDVTDAVAVRAAVDAAVNRFGALDILVSNAGILVSGDSTEFDIAKWRRVIDINLTGVLSVRARSRPCDASEEERIDRSDQLQVGQERQL